ncbi:MAG: ABC transporter ATP-binding protein/permease [Planctomycetes bacterium]|nr:ABC transporter ATP-binding protein/permease [Planctomycetota bacterium]
MTNPPPPSLTDSPTFKLDPRIRASRRRYAAYLTRRKQALAKQGTADGAGESGDAKDAKRKRARSFMDLLGAFLKLMKGHYHTLAIALITVTLSTLAIMALPASTKLIIDYILSPTPGIAGIPDWVPGPREPKPLLWSISLSILAISFVSLIIATWGRYHATRLTKRISALIRRRAFDHAAHLPLHRIQFYKSGGISSILREDAGQAGELVFSMIYNPFKSIIQLLVTLIILGLTDWRMLVGGILIIPVVFITHRTWITRIRPIYKDIRVQRTNVDAHTTEVFGGVRVVRSFDRTRAESTRFTTGQHLMIRKEMLVWWWSRILEVAWGVLIPLASGAVTIYAGYAILDGSLTLGDLFMFTAYLLMLLGPLELLTSTAANIQTNLAAFDRILDLEQEPPEFAGIPATITLDPHTVRGGIELRHVTFAYPRVQSASRDSSPLPPPEPVLHDINLTIHAGENIALVGASGAGKTTLCNLIARFYDPSSGSIFLDGTDLKTIEPASYRRLLGIVEQDVFLFDGTVAENIAYGRRDATRAQIEHAAKLAYAHDFITGLEPAAGHAGGYDTLIGERGVRLSGGQKQRIAIARALLADPKILILDEATSNLDAESEAFIQRSLSDLMKGRTSFIIAHRLSTVRNADRIVVLDKGRIIEIGRHEELLAARGRYAELLRTQIEATREDVPVTK